MNHQEPRFPERTMFSMPTLSGHEQFSHLVSAYGGADAVAKDFRIAQEALRAYLAGVMEPPLSLLLAVYWQGPYGFKHAFSETHWANEANFARAKAAEARCDQLVLLVDQCRQIVGPAFEVLLSSNGLHDLVERQDKTPLPSGVRRKKQPVLITEHFRDTKNRPSAIGLQTS
ncbi:MAG TPA: hypothetical protein VNT52_17575 [Acidimicrobiales bacterium]|nr:hypothetical protein [Acidimicrobiales bacterium]